MPIKGGAEMGEPSVLDRAYNFIMRRMVETGVAPYYTELASELGLSVDEGRKTLRDLMATGVPGAWLAPGTDYVASYAPFSNLPTQYKISVEGRQNWFGQ
jgi:hypothetical protein